MKKKNVVIGLIILIVLILVIILILLISTNYLKVIPKKTYTAEDFNIQVVKSQIDYDNDGIDDYTDIMLGARKDAQNMPTYKSAYYKGGYPPDNEGVCTDLVWRAFKDAGYILKDLVDEDIKNNKQEYKDIQQIDTNIDFRRVYNLKVFFDRNAEILTNNVYEIDKFQPGDIVIFEESHIGIISDKRNKKGIPYLIHNTGQLNREEDVLEGYKNIITGHYRWNMRNLKKNTKSIDKMKFNLYNI